MSYTYKYQFLSQGQYALVDCVKRNIWFTTDNESLAHKIKEIFCGKVNLIVLDLSVFENFNTDVVSSENCLHWYIPHTSDMFLTIPNVNDTKLKSTIKRYPLAQPTSTPQLVDLPLADRIYELHDQILMYQHIVKLVQDLTRPKLLAEYDQFQIEIDKIFEVEIHIADIEARLQDLARKNFGLLPFAPGCVMSTVCGNFYE
jgi:hypothetical protein